MFVSMTCRFRLIEKPFSLVKIMDLFCGNIMSQIINASLLKILLMTFMIMCTMISQGRKSPYIWILIDYEKKKKMVKIPADSLMWISQMITSPHVAVKCLSCIGYPLMHMSFIISLYIVFRSFYANCTMICHSLFRFHSSKQKPTKKHIYSSMTIHGLSSGNTIVKKNNTKKRRSRNEQ